MQVYSRRHFNFNDTDWGRKSSQSKKKATDDKPATRVVESGPRAEPLLLTALPAPTEHRIEESGEKALLYTQFWWPRRTFTMLPGDAGGKKKQTKSGVKFDSNDSVGFGAEVSGGKWICETKPLPPMVSPSLSAKQFNGGQV